MPDDDDSGDSGLDDTYDDHPSGPRTYPGLIPPNGSAWPLFISSDLLVAALLPPQQTGVVSHDHAVRPPTRNRAPRATTR